MPRAASGLGVGPRASRSRFMDLGAWLAAVGAVARRIIGVPDYECYIAHLQARHPDAPPVSREEFARQRLEDRYSRPGTRCC